MKKLLTKSNIYCAFGFGLLLLVQANYTQNDVAGLILNIIKIILALYFFKLSSKYDDNKPDIGSFNFKTKDKIYITGATIVILLAILVPIIILLR
ncbi:hypothetical protein PRVXH_001831 [Proteinivorax hydrogeniformans]|uniref:Uncharacterized protein n=1 Tax=Proteinivorax hydrogeniformans TaxID=1826727 RepID=A0AAU8HQT9_9FIRM